ncbi:hypothetical protein KSY96_02465 [Phocaeicola vulgatus]|jgi:hypothetical protein|uniref:hypothetical protein n=1 Tax=Phocaeicola vulgatus TaxID=821 RepID=UPI0018A04690|nr:hypothetical protein [Phocaeicola vulgatus]MBV4063088.1 hypothetical protein [Phocaeicola vulgatus]MBV4112964.1 hypothetical protein [Phocaeicola vulgatus]
MKRKIAIYLPLFCILSYWYIELAAILCTLILTGNITNIFKGFKYNHLILLFLFVCLEMVIMIFLDYDMRKFFEQIGLITITGIAYRTYFIHVLKSNISLFVKCYLNVTTIAVVYALVAYALHITIGGRLAGWAGEPGDISLLILPTLVYYFYHKEISIRSGITAIAFILATSTASFTSLFIVLSIFLFIYNRKNFIKLISASLIVFVVGSIISNFLSENKSNNNEAAIKFKETWNMLQNEHANFHNIETLNASSYAFLANMYVAKSAPSRLLGTGLGTHPINYAKIYPKSSTRYRLYGLNSNDAYSLSIRIFSELGIIGLLYLFIFIYKNFNSKSLFSFMALGYLINACITGGHYTANGAILFFVFFYFAGRYIPKDAFLGKIKYIKRINLSKR